MVGGTINRENRLYNSKPSEIKKRVARNKAHRTMERKMGYDIKADVDHITPLSKGGGTGASNLRIRDPKKNRSFRRNKDGSMK